MIRGSYRQKNGAYREEESDFMPKKWGGVLLRNRFDVLSQEEKNYSEYGEEVEDIDGEVSE